MANAKDPEATPGADSSELGSPIIDATIPAESCVPEASTPPAETDPHGMSLQDWADKWYAERDEARAECQRLREALTAKEEEYENRLAGFLQMSEERDKAEAQVTRLQGELDDARDSVRLLYDERDKAEEELANERRITDALNPPPGQDNPVREAVMEAVASRYGSCDNTTADEILAAALAAAREAARNETPRENRDERPAA